jgi:hypothetical protein
MIVSVRFHEMTRPALEAWHASLGSTNGERDIRFHAIIKALTAAFQETRGRPLEVVVQHVKGVLVYEWWYKDVALVSYILKTEQRVRKWWNPRRWFGNRAEEIMSVTVIGWTPRPDSTGNAAPLQR